MAPRIIVHAGFHKTGTTSLQHYLRSHRPQMRRFFDYIDYRSFPEVTAAANTFSQMRNPLTLRRFRLRLRRALDGRVGADVLVLSAEAFSGLMPGHRRWTGAPILDYGGAVPLAFAVRDVLGRIAPDAAVEFAYTTREREAWIASVWAHLVRSIRMTDDLGTFRARFDPKWGPTQAAQRIAEALPCPVHLLPLEATMEALTGPAGPILDLAGVPPGVQARWPMAVRKNTGNDAEETTQLLSLNRSIRGREALRAAKAALLDARQ
ncbi:MAG: hypothetical protein ACU0CI_13890 [Shimia sp.]